MKNLWKSLDSKWQWILKIASILAVLTGGGFTISGFIDFSRDIRNAPDDIEELYIAVEYLELKMVYLLKSQEMAWQMFRENTEDPDILLYVITYENGSVFDVDIRQSHLGNNIAFIFDYTIWPARWSDTNRGYYIIGPLGKEIRISKKNGN